MPQPWGRRPVVLLTRDDAYSFLTWVAVAPLTSTLRTSPSVVRLDPRDDGVPQQCVISLDNLQSIRAEWIESQLTRLRTEKLVALDEAIHFTLGLRN